jgi:ectoine hydrolase
VLKRHGHSNESCAGYSIGLSYPPDRGERTASSQPGDQTVMCFHFQSGMRLDDFGAAISEPFVVTDNGGEHLSHVARELIVIN